jgi:hypothetical protein
MANPSAVGMPGQGGSMLPMDLGGPPNSMANPSAVGMPGQGGSMLPMDLGGPPNSMANPSSVGMPMGSGMPMGTGAPPGSMANPSGVGMGMGTGMPGSLGAGAAPMADPEPLTLKEEADEAIRAGDEKAAFDYLYASIVAGEDEELVQEYRWCGGLRRPALGVRWGVGVEIEISPKNYQGGYFPIGSTQTLPERSTRRGNNQRGGAGGSGMTGPPPGGSGGGLLSGPPGMGSGGMGFPGSGNMGGAGNAAMAGAQERSWLI